MSVKNETPLQERIQKYIRSIGGYIIKTHGDMISEPGIPDLICCYRGIFIALEVKIDDNTPSRHQGIHCRNIWKSGGIAVVVWGIEEVIKLLEVLDSCIKRKFSIEESIEFTRSAIKTYSIDDGTRW